MKKDNLILMTDSYKPSHSKIYPLGTTYMQSYLESRTSESTEITFFGLQYILKEYLEGVRVTVEDVEDAKEFAEEEKIESITAIYNELGIKRLGEEKIELYFNTAEKILQDLPVTELRKVPLQTLSRSMLGRSV